MSDWDSDEDEIAEYTLASDSSDEHDQTIAGHVSRYMLAFHGGNISCISF